MKCPHCNVNLLIADKNGVEIDYCPECRGIWLDRGELEKIMERANSGYYQEYRRDGGHDSHHDYKQDKHYKHREKRSFFEMFDFG